MAGRTDFITDARWEDVWTIWYTLVDDAYQTLEQHYGAWRRSGPQPLFSDSEAITVGLIIDTWFGGHEALGLSFSITRPCFRICRPMAGLISDAPSWLCSLIRYGG